MPAQFVRVIPHSQLSRTDFYVSLATSDDARLLPDVRDAFYLMWHHCAESWWRGGFGADGSLSHAEIELLLDRRNRTTRKIVETMVAHGWLLERTDGRLEVAGFCLIHDTASGPSAARARRLRGVCAKQSEQNQALDPPLDLDQDIQTTTTTTAADPPPARARVHSAKVERPEADMHPREPEPPHPADDPSCEPPVPPTARFRQKRVLCVDEKNPVKPEKPKLHLVAATPTSHQTRQDDPGASQEVDPMSEPTPTPSRPAEANVDPLNGDGSDLPPVEEQIAAATPAQREILEPLLRMRAKQSAEMREEGLRELQEKARAAAAAEAARQAKAVQAKRDARPMGLPDVNRTLDEMGIPGTVSPANYRHWVTMGEVREAVAQLREDRKITAPNAGIVNHRAQILAAKRANKSDAQCTDAIRPALSVVSHVASRLAAG
jgi:hypothetical protein